MKCFTIWPGRRNLLPFVLQSIKSCSKNESLLLQRMQQQWCISPFYISRPHNLWEMKNEIQKNSSFFKCKVCVCVRVCDGALRSEWKARWSHRAKKIKWNKLRQIPQQQRRQGSVRHTGAITPDHTSRFTVLLQRAAGCLSVQAFLRHRRILNSRNLSPARSCRPTFFIHPK